MIKQEEGGEEEEKKELTRMTEGEREREKPGVLNTLLLSAPARSKKLV